MDSRTVPIARPPRNRVPLTELRRDRAVARDVQSRQGADARGNLALRDALGSPDVNVVLSNDQCLLIKKALEREAEERSKYAFDLSADAERLKSTDLQASRELHVRAARLARESDNAIDLGDLVYDAKSVTIALAPSQCVGGGR